MLDKKTKVHFNIYNIQCTLTMILCTRYIHCCLFGSLKTIFRKVLQLFHALDYVFARLRLYVEVPVLFVKKMCFSRRHL